MSTLSMRACVVTVVAGVACAACSTSGTSSSPADVDVPEGGSTIILPDGATVVCCPYWASIEECSCGPKGGTFDPDAGCPMTCDDRGMRGIDPNGCAVFVRVASCFDRPDTGTTRDSAARDADDADATDAADVADVADVADAD